MAWILLFLAGLFEVGFTTAMKLSDGFTKLWPCIAFAVCAVSSFALLTIAIRTIPLGSAYAVWTGLGAVGTIVIGIAFFNESADASRLFFLAMISVNLAVINFLPLPIVDGGLFLFLVYEKIKGRPPSIAFQNFATIVGMFLIGTVLLVVTWNDVARILG